MSLCALFGRSASKILRCSGGVASANVSAAASEPFQEPNARSTDLRAVSLSMSPPTTISVFLGVKFLR